MSSRLIRKHCAISADGEKLLENAITRLGLSARAHDRILKVARTIADLEPSPNIEPKHLGEAIQYRTLDRQLLGMRFAAEFQTRLRTADRIDIIVYTDVHKEHSMSTLKVGIREFREKLATFILEADTPLAITRHGDTVGFYIPVRRKRTETERAALEEAAARLQQILAAKGISEDEIVSDFKRWRSAKNK